MYESYYSVLVENLEINKDTRDEPYPEEKPPWTKKKKILATVVIVLVAVLAYSMSGTYSRVAVNYIAVFIAQTMLMPHPKRPKGVIGETR